MKKMRFNVKCVKECLMKNGIVFTVRKWRSYEKNTEVQVEGVGTCLKQRLRRIKSAEDLKHLVKLSGFETVEEWWKAIERFGATDGWLYFVRVTDP